MTIRNRERAQALDNFRRCVDDAPAGTYEHAKALGALLGEVVEGLNRQLREAGYRTDNCDSVFEVEAFLYDYVKRCNPDNPVFPTAEGFGESMAGPERERVRAQAAATLATLRALGVV